jgi:HEPN domain-containing protein
MAQQQFSGVSEQGKAALHRLEDAKSLLKEKRWRGAMYLAGYAVECILKKQLMIRFSCDTLGDLEDELQRRNLMAESDTVFSHSFEPLLRIVGGLDRLRQDNKLWARFIRVNRWIPAWRYSALPARSEEAEDFVEAVGDTVKWIENNIG